jgi:signal transduction histidine kinase
MTRRIAIILNIILALIIFTHPEHLSDPSIVFEHLMHIFVFITLSIYTYNLVKNTFTQKFEKEEATRKLFEMVEVDRLKTDFVTVASHQLRTPLSSAAWGLDNVLSEDSVSENDKHIIKESYDRIKKASQIVTEMLQAIDVSHIESNVNAGKVDLAKVVKEAIDELYYLTIRNGVKVETSAVGEVTVEADQKLLKAGITNIIDNAIRYSPKGTVKVSLLGDSVDVHLTVKDNGSGISKDDMPYIFSKFFRGKNGLAIDPNESGVGLYITKKIIELHGGTINLKSEAEVGTELSITLPIVFKKEKKVKSPEAA